ncbi:Trm112 family protein [Sphingosinicella sp. LHD-64]|uniref:Trm112 family protein n=1 Tax=Sphingosinicella sp. LHD-64 TaxID=3072139 RepID=UPI00280FE164|nr:Trm112 family protein [Sphingosinicella sp. LHD-64]MDQ8757052.1 Trm112 family protein [Sphingosinicella sp. LHD-64]
MNLDPELLAKLVCPVTRAPLVYDEAAQELVSQAADLAYPIQDGVPVLLVEAARVIAA